ncbi:MAG: ABC transporter ATP-binding protein [Candidatus Heimdallarchaeaceae archaeon]
MIRKENSVIRTNNLVKSFDLDKEEKVKVLTGLNMHVEKGEFIAIMGPSGSGKSTLINILSTLETITDGEVFIAGINIKDLSSKELLDIRREKSAIVFQNFSLIPYLTAKENVKLPLVLKGVPDEDAEKKAIEYLETVGLYGRINHLPEELSGGEQQRVAIARALAHEPDIIYADEPTGNLDTFSGRDIINIFKVLSKERNITIVMVTHDHEAARQTDRLYILQEGKVVEEKVATLDKRTSKAGD